MTTWPRGRQGWGPQWSLTGKQLPWASHSGPPPHWACSMAPSLPKDDLSTNLGITPPEMEGHPANPQSPCHPLAALPTLLTCTLQGPPRTRFTGRAIVLRWFYLLPFTPDLHVAWPYDSGPRTASLPVSAARERCADTQGKLGDRHHNFRFRKTQPFTHKCYFNLLPPILLPSQMEGE